MSSNKQSDPNEVQVNDPNTIKPDEQSSDPNIKKPSDNSDPNAKKLSDNSSSDPNNKSSSDPNVEKSHRSLKNLRIERVNNDNQELDDQEEVKIHRREEVDPNEEITERMRSFLGRLKDQNRNYAFSSAQTYEPDPNDISGPSERGLSYRSEFQN